MCMRGKKYVNLILSPEKLKWLDRCTKKYIPVCLGRSDVYSFSPLEECISETNVVPEIVYFGFK